VGFKVRVDDSGEREMIGKRGRRGDRNPSSISSFESRTSHS